MQNIKKRCFASFLSIGLMAMPGMAYALWLGHAHSNILISTQYGQLGGLLPFITQDQWLGWFEAHVSYADLDKKAQSYLQEISVEREEVGSSSGVGMAMRYVWTSQLITGAYCFFNVPEMPTKAAVTLKKPIEINPGFEVMLPYYQTSLHVDLAWLKEGRERTDLYPYVKGAWKIETKIYNRLMFAFGAYHYHDRDPESPILSGVTLGLTYIWNENLNLFVKYNHNWYENEHAPMSMIFGGQIKLGNTDGCENRVKRYLRQPIDRHIGPITPVNLVFKKQNNDRDSDNNNGSVIVNRFSSPARSVSSVGSERGFEGTNQEQSHGGNFDGYRPATAPSSRHAHPSVEEGQESSDDEQEGYRSDSDSVSTDRTSPSSGSMPPFVEKGYKLGVADGPEQEDSDSDDKMSIYTAHEALSEPLSSSMPFDKNVPRSMDLTSLAPNESPEAKTTIDSMNEVFPVPIGHLLEGRLVRKNI